MSRVNKKTRQERTPTPKREAEIVENPDSYNDQTPVWSLSICDFDHSQWGICRCVQKASETEIIWKHLKTLETLTWREIKAIPSQTRRNSKNHDIETYKFCDDARKRLKEIKRDDNDTLFSIHVTNLIRVFGIREGRTFKILWFDMEHRVCPSRQ